MSGNFRPPPQKMTGNILKISVRTGHSFGYAYQLPAKPTKNPKLKPKTPKRKLSKPKTPKRKLSKPKPPKRKLTKK